MRRQETLLRLVALLRESPDLTSHQLRMAVPFAAVNDLLIAEARRQARAPTAPPPAAPEPETAAV